MSGEGGTSRETPYELFFSGGEVDFEGTHFPAIRAEAEAADMPMVDEPWPFVLLPSGRRLLRELLPDDATLEEPAREGEMPHASLAVTEYAALLFHAYNFAEHGRVVVETDETRVRALAENAFDGAAGSVREVRARREMQYGSDAWRFRAPAPAGYLRLPRNLFWARASRDAPAEPLDGMFWVVGRRLNLLLALGVRPRRPGFTSIHVSGPLVGEDAPPSWADLPMRFSPPDFANILPGGELDRLLGIEVPGEALRLASLIFRDLDRGDADG